MTLWTELIQTLQAGIFSFAQCFGGNVGAGIVCVSLLIRLAMLPLTLKLARRSLAHRLLMERLRPELERLRKRYGRRPERLAEKTQRLFARHGASPVDGSGLLGGLAQAPIFLALFSAVRRSAAQGGRFFWIADIARPDVLLTSLVAAMTTAATLLQPHLPEQGRWLVVALPALLTLLFLSRLAAGVGLYWGATTAVGVLQAALLRRVDRKLPLAPQEP